MSKDIDMTEVSEAHKNWIDNATFEQLLRHWRNASAGDEMFQGDTGDYYSKVMGMKHTQVGPSVAVQASKNIG